LVVFFGGRSLIANKAFKDSRKMDLGALAWVERSNKIVKETFA
jgi:hypothetical protein